MFVEIFSWIILTCAIVCQSCANNGSQFQDCLITSGPCCRLIDSVGKNEFVDTRNIVIHTHTVTKQIWTGVYTCVECYLIGQIEQISS